VKVLRPLDRLALADQLPVRQHLVFQRDLKILVGMVADAVGLRLDELDRRAELPLVDLDLEQLLWRLTVDLLDLDTEPCRRNPRQLARIDRLRGQYERFGPVLLLGHVELDRLLARGGLDLEAVEVSAALVGLLAVLGRLPAVTDGVLEDDRFLLPGTVADRI